MGQKFYRVGTFVVTICMLLSMASAASAHVATGEMIDKTNWEQAEGLVPEPVLNWVKNGDLVLGMGELNYDPAACYPDFALDSLKKNAGRYEIDETGWIVDAETSKPASHIIGFPFPKIDENDPKAGEKIMHNKMYTWYVYGNLRVPFQIIWIHPTYNLEREIDVKGEQAILQGWPGVKDLRNKERLEKTVIVSVRAPVDVKGTSILTWRYMSPENQDSTFGYVPAIRRVRQMSPANRSDSFVGSDMCVDDSNHYDGKIQAFVWKLLRKQDAIVPYFDENTQPTEGNEKGEWSTTSAQKYIVSGYEKEGWQGAGWAPTNYVWVRRPTYVIEMKSKDSYYNYGLQYMWVDAETFMSYYKVIHDRAGDYWKTMIAANSGYESTDGQMRFSLASHGLVVDDRTQHATGSELASPRNRVSVFADVNRRNFTLAGFQKYCR